MGRKKFGILQENVFENKCRKRALMTGTEIRGRFGKEEGRKHV